MGWSFSSLLALSQFVLFPPARIDATYCVVSEALIHQLKCVNIDCAGSLCRIEVFDIGLMMLCPTFMGQPKVLLGHALIYSFRAG